MRQTRRRWAVLGVVAATILFGSHAATAQSPSAKYRLGFLSPASGPTMASRIDAIVAGLKDLGYADGRDFTIVFRWGDGNDERLPVLAAELIALKVDIVLAHGAGATRAAHMASPTTPVICAPCGDITATGLVASLARPGGNVTGVSTLIAELTAKRLELLHELVPGASRIAVLTNPNDPTADVTLRELEAAIGPRGLQARLLKASTGREIDAAFATFAHERPDALFVAPSALFLSRRVQLSLLAAFHRVPTTLALRDFAEAGGLMSYGPSLRDAYRQVGVYAGRILKGAKPADLPVVQASKFELVINQQTARMLGLTVPDKLLVAADEVIE
jgi:putative tryptophan/tyrosine transport system substrate-binding protein